MVTTAHQCAVCGVLFDKERKGGRPPTTCSEECKKRRAIEHTKRWVRENPRKAKALARREWAKHYAKNRQHHIDRSIAYSKAHPEKKRARDAARYALTRGAPTAERFTLDEIYTRDARRCHLCGRLVRRADASMDHLVPVALGGEHTRANVALAHRSCNSSKKTSARDEQLRLIG